MALRTPVGLTCLLSYLLAASVAVAATPDKREEIKILSTGTASLVLNGRQAATVPIAEAVDGTRFALKPIAAVLGAELRLGPLGDSHTLIYEDRHIIVGPAQAAMVTVAPDGQSDRVITRLAQRPIRDGAGLKVSLELLDRALGEPLNFQFQWRPDTLELEVSRPELRRLVGSVNLVHQHQVSLVEIELSAEPRFRVERLPGALEIRLIGDRLDLPMQPPRVSDPLVTDIVVAPDRLRLELAENAVADEPRLLLQPIVRLVIEVFEGAARPSEGEAPRPPRAARQNAAGIRTIAIDPGHGGAETGAVGRGGTTEAELTLLVGRALQHQLERRLPVRVILTRAQDVDVPLETRSAIANQIRADLFISLHINSSFGSGAHGAESYFLSREASDQMAAALAAAETSAAGLTEDPELDLKMILWDLAQSYHLAESQRFANLVQEELNLTLGLRDRGVKQAPFSVLMGAKMPAVLVELGFLSNPEEEAELQNPVYRGELVDALVRAVIRFKRQIESDDVAELGSEDGNGSEAAATDPP